MDFIVEPSLVLYLPLYELDGASFASRDAYRHPCVVTGALWIPRGRKFDGSDDKIDLGNKAAYKPADALSLLSWVKNTGGLANEELINYRVAGGGNNVIYQINRLGVTVNVNDGSANGAIVSGLFSASLPATVYKMVGFAFSRANQKLYTYEEGLLRDTDAIGGDYPLLISGGAGSPVSLYVGCASSGIRHAEMECGEIWIYNRALTSQEFQHNYLATKWRYR